MPVPNTSPSASSKCRRFEANMFNRTRCQNCFRAKDVHSADALQQGKMTRKVMHCSYLYVAPENIDFSIPSHQTRRWQRRWFALFDDGQLTYALDYHPETVPHGTIDMSTCVSVDCAEHLTGHPHSISLLSAQQLLYLKADGADDIRRWREILCMFAEQNVKRPLNGQTDDSCSQTEDEQEIKLECHVMVGARKEKPNQRRRRLSDPLASAKVDVGRMDGYHGTPRSVKQRNRMAKEDVGVRRALSDVPLKGAQDIVVAVSNWERDTAPTVVSVPDSPCSMNEAPKVDVSTMHTLRKGWLMLRGRSDSDWQKHWVVLAGLSLKMYKDAWAEESGNAAVTIDVGDCQKVYPISVSRNYGIEIRCRRSRHIMSAMTPGIRDSWIAAIQHNLSNPSPPADDSQCSTPNSLLTVNKKKHIAYVAPESHHRTYTDGSSSEDEVELPGYSSHDDVSISERSVELESDDERDDRTPEIRDSRASERRRSLSPTVRRSPVSRVKERSSRRQRSPSIQENVQRSEPLGNNDVTSVGRQRGATTVVSIEGPQHSERNQLEQRLRLLESQVNTLRCELRDTRERLVETESENQKLRHMWREPRQQPVADTLPHLTELRQSLATAEAEILEKQQEIEQLNNRFESEPENNCWQQLKNEEVDYSESHAQTEPDTSNSDVQRLWDLLLAQTDCLVELADKQPQHSWTDLKNSAQMVRKQLSAAKGSPVHLSDSIPVLNEWLERTNRALIDLRTLSVSFGACARCSASGWGASHPAELSDRPLSALHVQLAARLSACLQSQHSRLAKRPLLDSEQFADVLAEAFSMEIVLVGEMANVLECKSDAQRLDLSVKLQDRRGTWIVLKRLLETLIDREIESLDDSMLEHVTLNLFPLFVDQLKTTLLARWRKAAGDLRSKCGTDAANPAGGSAALRSLSARLVCLATDDVSSASVTYNTLVRSELADVFARFQSIAENSASEGNPDASQRLVEDATDQIRSLATQLIDLLDDYMMKCAERNPNDGGNKNEINGLVVGFWNKIKESTTGSRDAMPSLALKLKAIEDAIELVTREVLDSNYVSYVAEKNCPAVALLLVFKGITLGLVDWTDVSSQKFEPSENVTPDLELYVGAQCGVDSLTQNVVQCGVSLDQYVRYYEPLARHLFDQSCMNATLQLGLALLPSDRQASAEVQRLREEFERERTRIKEEAEQWRQQAQLGASTNLASEVEELEQELLDTQATHSEEVSVIRSEFEQRLSKVQNHIGEEEALRRKLQVEMASMKKMNDHNMETLQRSHEQLIDSLRGSFESELQSLREQHLEMLNDEKEATRRALDAVQRAHDDELQKLRACSSLSPGGAKSPSQETMQRKHSTMLEQMSKELSELSAAYSAKCLENSQLEEKLADCRQTWDRAPFPEETEAQEEQMSRTVEELQVKRKQVESLEYKVQQLGLQVIQLQQAATLPNGNIEKDGLANGVAAQNGSADEASDLGSVSEYQPKQARQRHRNRRQDSRYHSSPHVSDSARSVPEYIMLEFRTAMSVPVAERRRFFESLGTSATVL